MSATSKTKQTGVASLSEVCSCFNLKRDAFYKYQKRFKQRKAVVGQVLKLVKQARKVQPRVGVRKLHNALFEASHNANLKIGRDSS